PGYTAHVAIVKTNLAQAYGAMGRRTESAAALEEGVDGLRSTLGIRDLRTLTSLNVLGGIHMMLGNVARAQVLFQEALPIERKLYPHDTQLARTLSGLASVNMLRGNAHQALPLADEALRIVLEVEGENSLDAALAYSNVAEAHRLLGHPDRSLPLFRKGRTI